jgi:integrase
MSTIYLEENLTIYKRESTYYMRLKTAPQQYVHRSLKTHVLTEARKRAHRQLVEFEIKKERGEQFAAPTLKQVIAEYTKIRELDNQRGKTSDAMLRQIKRVNKFWIEYAGNLRIDKITNKELADFIPWRKPTTPSSRFYPKMQSCIRRTKRCTSS